MNRKLLIFLTFLIMFFSIFTAINLQNLIIIISNFESFLNDNLIKFYLIYFVFMFISVIIFFPIISPLVLISGYFFGLIFGSILILISLPFGVLTLFFIKNKLAIFSNKKYSSKINNFKKHIIKNELEILLLLRLVPGSPFFLQNILAISCSNNLAKIFYSTLLGISPAVLITTSIGSQLKNISSNSLNSNKGNLFSDDMLILVILIISLLILRIIFKNKKIF